MPFYPALALCLLALLGACTEFPELDRASSPGALQAPYPALLPFEVLQASTALPPPADPAAALQARAAALRARATAVNALP